MNKPVPLGGGDLGNGDDELHDSRRPCRGDLRGENSTTAAMTTTYNCCAARIAKQRERQQQFLHMNAMCRINGGNRAPRASEECSRCRPIRHAELHMH